ncbi:phytoene desaturase family protein [Octadecabacter sp. G9-8]|uniref:Phytoene desaturase family protein n=1 Tax=Octadecabacter dasysiphoniae TaxID=2909341 RepID=A0ABS9CW94_9RHOB|nr:1-hydroxycarotenoid 3,4-desaturase CrtD [Octadecabacter dasysiphoniae]MCF2871538.1 phytoene desaturase family protein [Octadecabacter dasysiphoniae]
MSSQKHVIVIGAGVGGLASALRLLAAGTRVTVLEAAAATGGKMRTVPSAAGPVDAGPTVLTMRWVFDDLFAAVGETLDDHVTLTQADTIARHFWSDGTTLDLCADSSQSCAKVQSTFGAKAAQEFAAFSERAERLFTAFDAPMMRAAQPSSMALAATVLRDPRLLAAMAPHKTLAQLLETSFTEPKLRQLFGRYATYVGGSPYLSPALLSLIWHAEGTGVWAVKGGMHRLCAAMSELIQTKGGTIHLNSPVHAITPTNTGLSVKTNADTFTPDAVVFNGDPRALGHGLLGDDICKNMPQSALEPRSLSANVMAFAAVPTRTDLSHHNVFFGDNPKDEFGPLAQGHDPTDPTLYVCAQDRGGGHVPNGAERFEIIMNAPPCTDAAQRNEQKATACQTQILNRLAQMGLTFSPMPTAADLTQPADFHAMFPASLGSLYGRSPHGMTAGLKRPTARTTTKGLYLAGGGAHPGAGVPMATLSAMHAVAAIKTDLGLI